MNKKEINKIKNKFDSTTLYREDDDGNELEIEVYYLITPSERSYFNGMTGEGHPGSASEIEIILSLDKNDNEVPLTKEEFQFVLEQIMEEDEEESPDSSDREDYTY